MADAEEKARQEKIAAAKKRVEAMKKKKNKKGGAPKKAEEEVAKLEETAKEEAPKEDATKTPVETAETAEIETEAAAKPTEANIEEAEDNDKAVEDDKPGEPATPSLAQQSKLRSTSFRAGTSGSGSPFSPDGDTAPEIYRKNVAKIEELEKENKRLAKEAADSERRWNKAEDELADLREAEGDATAKGDNDTEKLKNEIASLQRQNIQLQEKISKGGHRQSISVAQPTSDLQAQIDSKSSTIESMEIEISKLKARAERQASGADTEKEQVTALEEKVARAEAAAGKAQRELQDLKHNLDRTAEKAVREGSERSSAETKIKTLEQELEKEKSSREELSKKAEGLEKKVTTLTTLHKEQDTRSQALRKEKEAAEKEAKDLRTKVEKLESENIKLKSRKSTDGGGGLDDEGVDELENEERLKLEKKIRSLEAQIHELRSGVWIEKRREMESTSPGFHDVDLHGASHGNLPSHRRTTGGGIGDLLQSGLNALTGGDDEFLEDDDADFDEDAFRKAHEEEAKRRIERIKEIKRSLKHWEGWRLDIADSRRGGGGGIGEIFEV